jgi:hypothetical protein
MCRPKPGLVTAENAAAALILQNVLIRIAAVVHAGPAAPVHQVAAVLQAADVLRLLIAVQRHIIVQVTNVIERNTVAVAENAAAQIL